MKKITAEVIERAFKKINLYTLLLVDKFKEIFNHSLEDMPRIRSLNFYMDKYLISHGYKLYCGSTKLGKLYYDDRVHPIKGVQHLYKVVVGNYKLEKENNNLRQLSRSTNYLKKTDQTPVH